MTLSGSDNFSMNASKVCTASLRKMGRLGIGKTADPEDLAIMLEALNVLLKSWKTLGIWLNQEVMLFLSESTQKYSLGGSVKAVPTSSVTQTAIATDAIAAAVNIEVDSTTGMTAADIIGIVLDDNSIHWDVIDTVTDGTNLVLTTGIESATSDGNAVYSYTSTSVITRPMDISEIRRRDNNDKDIPLSIISRTEYMNINQKSATGLTSQVYFDPQESTSDLYIWPTISDERHRLVFTVKRKIQDCDVLTHDLDIPQEWTRAVIWNLAKETEVEFGIDRETALTIIAIAKESLDEQKLADRNLSPVWFEFHV